MTETLNIHGHEVVFNKNKGKAVIEIQLGETEEECILIDIFSIDDKEYIALLSGETSEVYLFRYTDIYGDENIDLTMIDDEDEIDEVFHIFSHYWTDEMIDSLIEEYDSEVNSEE
ncbi:DUF1292 domain-containing protein [uncultured Anaerococcus sp.]|uniref:DUF1292 domain-containing protein n=1 Tax=uncultured Anaerococcus sp. TaxID=293428 RepID=UPI00288C4070|nr:DUF1292 domain-containing protein [uncultured Anaerococcus sp.]